MKTNHLKIRLPFAGAALATAIALLGSTAFAIDNLWLGVDNDWNNVANWSLGRLPANPNGQPSGDTWDDAVITTATAINYPFVTVNTAATPRDIMVGRGAGNFGQLDQVSGTVTYNGWFYIGRNGSTGVYNLADVNSMGSGTTGFGLGSGSLDYTANGRLWVGGTWASEGTGGHGTFNVNTSGTIRINDLAVGSSGHIGVMNVDAGTINTTGWNFIGKNEGTTGAVGTLRMAGGTLSNTGRTFIAEAGCTGTLILSGGSYKNTNNEVFVVGAASGGVGTVTINHAASLLQSTGELQIADQAGSLGTVNLIEGAVTVDNWFAVGRRGGQGILNMSGGTLTKTGGGNVTISTGTNGTGTINQTGGVFNNTASQTFLGESWNGDGNGTWNLSGTGQAVLGEIIFGNGGASQGTLNRDGGTLTATRIRDNTTGATHFNFNGGTLKAGANEAAFLAGLDAATVKAGGALIDTNGFNIAIDQALLDGGGGGGLTKSGAGTLTLNATNTYTGPTTVAAGVLAVNGSIASSSLTTVDAGATLRGTGTLGSTAVADVGHVAPGNSIGTLTISGSMTINGTLDIEYDDSLAGQKIDLLAVSGDLDISLAAVDFADISTGPVGLSGIAYIFATYGTLTGSQFASVVDLPTGYTIDYAYSGNNIALIPEPTAALLGALGLLGLLRRRRV